MYLGAVADACNMSSLMKEKEYEVRTLWKYITELS